MFLVFTIFIQPIFIFLAIAFIIVIGTLVLGPVRSRWFHGPADEEEDAWRKWIHQNLNEGHYNPRDSQYSLMCVVDWSRFNIIMFIVIPFLMTALGSVLFGILWSLNIGAHQGGLQGAWAIASFMITLAGGR